MRNFDVNKVYLIDKKPAIYLYNYKAKEYDNIERYIFEYPNEKRKGIELDNEKVNDIIEYVDKKTGKIIIDSISFYNKIIIKQYRNKSSKIFSEYIDRFTDYDPDVRDDNNNIIPLEIPYRQIRKEINKDNYHLCTNATFTHDISIDYLEYDPSLNQWSLFNESEFNKFWDSIVPAFDDEFISPSGSCYKVINNIVYRKSDHWGYGIASCNWGLNRLTYPENYKSTLKSIAHCKISDFRINEDCNGRLIVTVNPEYIKYLKIHIERQNGIYKEFIKFVENNYIFKKNTVDMFEKFKNTDPCLRSKQRLSRII